MFSKKVIRDTIQYFINNPFKLMKVGKNGPKAVENKYNLLIQEKNY